MPRCRRFLHYYRFFDTLPAMMLMSLLLIFAMPTPYAAAFRALRC